MNNTIRAAAVFCLLLIVSTANLLIVSKAEPPEGWTEDIRLTEVDENSSTRARIDIDSENNMHIVWNDFRHGPGEIYYMKLDDAGNVLVEEKVITDLDAASSNLGDMAVDSEDSVHIIWSDVRDSGPIPNLELYYEKLDSSGNTLVDETRITFAAYYSHFPSLAVDSLDNIHIAYCEEIDVGTLQEEVHYIKLDNTGNILVGDTAVTPADGEESLFPDIAVDSFDNVHIVWLDDRNETGTTKNQDYYYSKLDGGGGTLIDDTLIFEDGDHFKPSIAVDSQDMVQMVISNRWFLLTNEKKHMYYMKLDGNGNPVIAPNRLSISEENASHAVFSLDSEDNLHVVWEDERHGNPEILYMKLDGTGNIVQDELRLTQNQYNSTLPVIALNGTDGKHVVWSDDRDFTYWYSELYYKRGPEESQNQAPTVEILSPYEGETLSGIHMIEGTAADTDGSVSLVEIKINDDLWFSVEGTTSWSHEWNTSLLDDGQYTIYARSFDGQLYSGEEMRNITVNNTPPNEPPTVDIVSPHEGQNLSGVHMIEGTAADTDGSVSLVEIKINDGLWFSVEGTTSWTHEWNTSLFDNGQYSIYARSFDGELHSGEEMRNITVNNIPPNEPPTVTITPFAGVVSGTVRVNGTASDTDGNVQRVQLKFNDGDWIAAAGTTSWSYTWATTGIEDGDHFITARSRDDSGDYSQHKTIPVSVSNWVNTPPSAGITSPTQATVSGEVTVGGWASDVDGDGTISIVQVRIDGDWEDAQGTAEWFYTWDTTVLDDGEYIINARAFDGHDYSTVSSLSVSVDNPHPPSLTITSDIPDKASGTLVIRGRAADEDGEIQYIAIQIDDGDWKVFSDSEQWDYELDTGDLSNGRHTIRIRVDDDEGESYTEAFTIEVDNPPESPMWLLIIGSVLMAILLIIIGIKQKKKPEVQGQYHLKTV